MRIKLTEVMVADRRGKLAPPVGCNVGWRLRVYDIDLHGFGLLVTAKGRKSFFIEYGPERRRRRMTIGKYPTLAVAKARAMAKERLGEVATGADPLDERNRERAMLTVRDWVTRYMVGVRERKRAPRADKRYLEDMACERWGSRPLDSVTVGDIERGMEHLAGQGHRIAANRFLASVRACLQAAWRAGILATNPAMRVRPYRENTPRARVLSDEELERFVAALADEPDPFVRATFTLLVETGARKSEVLRARWEDLDLDAATWRIPSPKAGKPQVVPLPHRTVVLLRALPRLGPWLIPGRDPLKPRTELRDQWAALKKRAEVAAHEDGDKKFSLADLHIHDVRRSFGLRVARAAGLHIASKLLRHSDVRTTEAVYAPLELDDLRKATERAAKVLDFTSKTRRSRRKS